MTTINTEELGHISEGKQISTIKKPTNWEYNFKNCYIYYLMESYLIQKCGKSCLYPTIFRILSR